MATARQMLGAYGETAVTQGCACPNCKRSGTPKRLPVNFKCADVICDFCGHLTQVKTAKVADLTTIPKRILGADWGPQKERMDYGNVIIYTGECISGPNAARKGR